MCDVRTGSLFTLLEDRVVQKQCDSKLDDHAVNNRGFLYSIYMWLLTVWYCENIRTLLMHQNLKVGR
jgi:hypothetical protein